MLKCEHCGVTAREGVAGECCPSELCAGQMAAACHCEDCGKVAFEDEIRAGACAACQPKWTDDASYRAYQAAG